MSLNKLFGVRSINISNTNMKLIQESILSNEIDNDDIVYFEEEFKTYEKIHLENEVYQVEKITRKKFSATLEIDYAYKNGTTKEINSFKLVDPGNIMTEILKAFRDQSLMLGRMISASKSDYRVKYPDHQAVFNANVSILGEGKIWHGDLDLTLDAEKLQKVADSLGKMIFVTREMDGHWAELSETELMQKAVWKSK